jgi:phosphomannomutase
VGTKVNQGLEIRFLMEESGVIFGTSGARGLVTKMNDRVCAAYTLGFLGHLLSSGRIERGTRVAISGDLRPSTERISEAVCFAARYLGFAVEFCGWIPSPALALRGIQEGIPAIMVTGSHIPDDRNGIKFNTPDGEVTKEDEAGMLAQCPVLPDVFDVEGRFLDESTRARRTLPPVAIAALTAYRARYIQAFPARALSGLRVGVYGHSAVGRDFLAELYEELGAEVFRLGWSDTFVPVDTEAIRREDCELSLGWASQYRLDAIVSTDGDSDRPLTSDEFGAFVRGDVSGILTARFVGADAVALPVSCNTAVDSSGFFPKIARTRIGSPYVISGMEELKKLGAKAVVGYEANGGFLSLCPLKIPGGSTLAPLPTRDAVLVHLALLVEAKTRNLPISALLQELPQRFTESDRDQSFATERSQILLKRLREMPSAVREKECAMGSLLDVDETDGMRLSFESGEILHLRPSGNAPELRCYAEASSSSRARELVARGLSLAARLVPAE